MYELLFHEKIARVRKLVERQKDPVRRPGVWRSNNSRKRGPRTQQGYDSNRRSRTLRFKQKISSVLSFESYPGNLFHKHLSLLCDSICLLGKFILRLMFYLQVVFLLCEKPRTLGELPQNLRLFLRVGTTVKQYRKNWRSRLVYELTHTTKQAIAKRLTFGRRGFRNMSMSTTTNTGFVTEHEVPSIGSHPAEQVSPGDDTHSAEEVTPSGAHSVKEGSSDKQHASCGESCVELGLSLQVENSKGS